MTTTPDFRALCAELAQLLQNCPVTSDTDWIAERMALLYRVRAALATSPPEPPTDEELSDLWVNYDGIVDLRDFVTVARAVLERWGR